MNFAMSWECTRSGRELDQVGEARALRGKRCADIGEHQRALRVEIGRSFAVLVGADLAGDEQELRRFDSGDLRILPERLAEAVGVEDLELAWSAPRLCEKTQTVASPSFPRKWESIIPASAIDLGNREYGSPLSRGRRGDLRPDARHTICGDGSMTDNTMAFSRRLVAAG